jgi:hypothetical protein
LIPTTFPFPTCFVRYLLTKQPPSRNSPHLSSLPPLSTRHLLVSLSQASQCLLKALQRTQNPIHPPHQPRSLPQLFADPLALYTLPSPCTYELLPSERQGLMASSIKISTGDLRSAAKEYQRDRNHNAKWARGFAAAPGKRCPHKDCFGYDTCTECAARPQHRDEDRYVSIHPTNVFSKLTILVQS